MPVHTFGADPRADRHAELAAQYAKLYPPSTVQWYLRTGTPFPNIIVNDNRPERPVTQVAKVSALAMMTFDKRLKRDEHRADGEEIIELHRGATSSKGGRGFGVSSTTSKQTGGRPYTREDFGEHDG